MEGECLVSIQCPTSTWEARMDCFRIVICAYIYTRKILKHYIQYYCQYIPDVLDLNGEHGRGVAGYSSCGDPLLQSNTPSMRCHRHDQHQIDTQTLIRACQLSSLSHRLLLFLPFLPFLPLQVVGTFPTFWTLKSKTPTYLHIREAFFAHRLHLPAFSDKMNFRSPDTIPI